MPTRSSLHRRALALSLAFTLLSAGCRGKSEPAKDTVPALRFAGVNLEYALERIATESNWALGIDEITPKDLSPDLTLVRVDVDLPAGSLDEVMRKLRDTVGGFDYKLDDGVIFVRSNLLLDSKTNLDLPYMKGGTFHGELAELVRFIMAQHPTSFISLAQIQDGFAGPQATFDIPENASLKDVLILYARASKSSWVIHRGGETTRDTQGRPAIMATTIEPRGPRTGTSRLPFVYNRLSTIAGLADASDRLKTAFLIFDRTVLQDVRGILNLPLQRDPRRATVNETLDVLAASGFGPGSWHFHWREEDGVPVLRTNHFLYYLRGRDMISAPLLGGDFEGSLPELARWINSHWKSPAGDVFMGGEITDGMPKGKVHVESGETVDQVLVAFAKSSGVSPYVLVLDLLNPFSGVMVEHPRSWRGAYLQDLSEWRSHPEDDRVNGVLPPGETR
ncbi:MAG: hypothetical protein ACHQ6T_03590 [Myxococcota bacterium]